VIENGITCVGQIIRYVPRLLHLVAAALVNYLPNIFPLSCRYGVVLKLLKWSDLSSLSEKCGLYHMLMNPDLLRHYKSASDLRLKPSSIRVHLAGLRIIVNKFFDTEKCSLMEYTGKPLEYIQKW